MQSGQIIAMTVNKPVQPLLERLHVMRHRRQYIVNSILSGACLSLSLWGMVFPQFAHAIESDMPLFFRTLWSSDRSLQNAQTEASNIEDAQDKSIAFLLLAEAYIAQHNDSNAKSCLQQSLSTCGANPIAFGLTQRYVKAFVNLSDFDQALALLPRARTKLDLEQSRLLISEGYLRSNQLDKAYEILKSAPASAGQLHGPDPITVQLVELISKAMATNQQHLQTLAVNCIHDPYDRAVVFLALSHYYSRSDAKLSKQFLGRALDEAKLTQPCLVPYNTDGIALDRSTAHLLAQIAGELAATQPQKARSAIQSALFAVENEYDTAKYTNTPPALTTVDTLAVIQEQAHALHLEELVRPVLDKLADRLIVQTNNVGKIANIDKLLAKQTQQSKGAISAAVDARDFRPPILGLHPAILKDARIADEVNERCESNDLQLAFSTALTISELDLRAKWLTNIAEKAATKAQTDLALKALDAALQADPEASATIYLQKNIKVFVLCNQVDKAFRLLRFVTSEQVYFNSLITMSEAYAEQGNFEKALQLLSAIPDGETRGKDGKGDLKGEALRTIARQAVAQSKINLAVGALTGLGTPDEKASTFQEFGRILLNAGKTADAKVMLDNALAQAELTKAQLVPLTTERTKFRYQSKARLLGSIALDYKDIDKTRAREILQQARTVAGSGEEKVCKLIYGVSPLVEKLKTTFELDEGAKKLDE